MQPHAAVYRNEGKLPDLGVINFAPIGHSLNFVHTHIIISVPPTVTSL